MTIKQKINACKNNKGTYTLIDYLFTKAKTETFKQGVKEGFYKECSNGIVIFADEGGKGGVSIEYTK